MIPFNFLLLATLQLPCWRNSGVVLVDKIALMIGRYLSRAITMGDVSRLGVLEPENGKRSQSQTLTR